MKGQAFLWLAQRVSAALLAVFVVVHLATVVFAVRGGLSAAEILGRTRGSIGWALFYASFVLAVAVHVPLGLRAVCAEAFGWRGAALEATAFTVGVFLAVFGLRAVWSVFA